MNEYNFRCVFINVATVFTEVGKGLVVSKDVTPQLVRVLRINESPEVIETCLELITNIAETGNFIALASGSFT